MEHRDIWEHKTSKVCRPHDPVGLDFFYEPNGFVAIYERYKDGTRWPCRNVNLENITHAHSVINSWLSKYDDSQINDYTEYKIIAQLETVVPPLELTTNKE